MNIKSLYRFLGFALSISLLIAFMGTGNARAAFPGINGKIVFQSNRDGNFEIYTMDADGSNLNRLTNNNTQDMNPAWSANGGKITFQSDRDGNNEIYCMDTNGANQTRLTKNTADDNNPTWSPDGTRIAFIRSFGARSGDVYVMNSDGTSETKLTNYTTGFLPDAFSVAWSPDGTKLMFLVALSDENEEIYTMNTDGTHQAPLTDFGVLTFSANWSPDGSRITYSGGIPGSAEVYVMNSDGSGTIPLSSNLDSSSAWSPDGSRIVFVSGKDGDGEILVMNSDGSNQIQLTNNSFEDGHPDWQPIISTFRGFFPPVRNLPTFNLAKAGRAIPVKFSLGSHQGSSVISKGYPKSQLIQCDSTANVDGIEQTVNTGSSSLSYDPISDKYTYVWKTDKSWASTCRQFVILLSDGTYHRANFKFK